VSGEQVSSAVCPPDAIFRSISARFIIREFDFNEEEIEKQREELQIADLSEKELWVRDGASCLTKSLKL
jgi:hypothetical protein